MKRAQENNQKQQLNVLYKFDMHLTHYHFKNQLQSQSNIHYIFVNSKILTCQLCNQTLKTCMRFIGHLKTHGVIQNMYKDKVEKKGLVRNHIYVNIVKNHLGMKEAGKHMNKFTPVRNHIHANVVT